MPGPGPDAVPSHRRLDALLAAPIDVLPWTPDPREPVVLYGGGNTGRELLALLGARDVPVLGVLDQRGAALGSALGVRCVSPDGDLLDAAARERTPVLLAVHNRNADVAAIAALLRARGWGRVITFPQVHAALEASLGERFWLGARQVYADSAVDVVAGHDRLADEESRELYVQTIDWRLTGDPARAPRPTGKGVQYFPGDVPPHPGALRFADIGAFDGDSLLAACQATGAMECAWAFEPDATSFRALTRTARRLCDEHATVIECWPCAVGDENGPLRFAAGHGEASRVDPGGEMVVPCVRFDDALPAARPSFMKFDIEGAEPAALSGARATIARSRPRLAVCVYHRPEHLWSLGRQIAQLDLDYDLYLRAHAHAGFDLVLYAVPR